MQDFSQLIAALKFKLKRQQDAVTATQAQISEAEELLEIAKAHNAKRHK